MKCDQTGEIFAANDNELAIHGLKDAINKLETQVKENPELSLVGSTITIHIKAGSNV